MEEYKEDSKKQSRNWNGVEFQFGEVPPQDWLEALHKRMDAVFTVGQLEKCPTTGKPHIQFNINFKIGRRFNWMKKMSMKTRWSAVIIDNGAYSYAMKEETRLEGPWEFGIRPV